MKLPKAYREAMLLQARSIGKDSLVAFADTLMLSEYRGYKTLQAADTAQNVKEALLRRDYGNTLWWYIDKN